MKKRADLLLVEKKLAKTRSKAQAMIMAGQVFVNEKRISKSGDLIETNSIIRTIKLHPEWVSRGSLKLIHALNKFGFNIENLVCLDIGASTGGFSEVLLKYKANKVYSVDVGTNQLNEKLKKEKRIINIEKTNARYLSEEIIDQKIDLIVCDVSFISMKKVLKPNLKFLKKNTGKVIGLIKPQFEASKSEVKKGGLIIDKLIHKRICDDYINWFDKFCDMEVIGIIESPIKGQKGNIEFLIAAKFKSQKSKTVIS